MQTDNLLTVEARLSQIGQCVKGVVIDMIFRISISLCVGTVLMGCSSLALAQNSAPVQPQPDQFSTDTPIAPHGIVAPPMEIGFSTPQTAAIGETPVCSDFGATDGNDCHDPQCIHQCNAPHKFHGHRSIGHGCCSTTCQYFGYFPARPFGAYAKQTLSEQVRNGFVAQLVFFHMHFDFDGVTWRLTEAGQRNVDRITRIYHLHPTEIIIEPTGDPSWDEARRNLAMLAFQQRQMPIGIENIVVRRVGPNGISGVEARSIYERRAMPIRLRPTGTTGRFQPSSSFRPSGGNGR